MQVAGHSSTIWFPYVTSVTAEKEVVQCLNEHYTAVTRFVSNLAPVQVASMFATENPHAFHPHLGLFGSDYMLGSALQMKK
jgi:hypothetical protein